MITISDRTEYIGSYVRPEVKAAIKQAADNQKMSISAWIADTIETRLIDGGFDLSEKSPERPLLDVAEA